MEIQEILKNKKLFIGDVTSVKEAIKTLSSLVPCFGWDIIKDDEIVHRAQNVKDVVKTYLYTDKKGNTVCGKFSEPLSISNIEKYLSDNPKIKLFDYIELFDNIAGKRENYPAMLLSQSLLKAGAEVTKEGKFLKISFIGLYNKDLVIIHVKHSHSRFRMYFDLVSKIRPAVKEATKVSLVSPV